MGRLLKNVNDVELFMEAVKKCKRDVIIRNPLLNEEYNLKSQLSAYIAIGELARDHGDEWEIFANKDDEQYLFHFFEEIRKEDK